MTTTNTFATMRVEPTDLWKHPTLTCFTRNEETNIWGAEVGDFSHWFKIPSEYELNCRIERFNEAITAGQYDFVKDVNIISGPSPLKVGHFNGELISLESVKEYIEKHYIIENENIRFKE